MVSLQRWVFKIAQITRLGTAFERFKQWRKEETQHQPQALRKVADDGHIVAFSIHQPSSKASAQFDDLFLSVEEVVFFRKAGSALEVKRYRVTNHSTTHVGLTPAAKNAH
ncbi:hypothetical protein Ancab_031023 [Ancistrocladus abbreviatus]